MSWGLWGIGVRTAADEYPGESEEPDYWFVDPKVDTVHQIPVKEAWDYRMWDNTDDPQSWGDKGFTSVELSDDIGRNGIKHPIEIATDGTHAHIEDGHHRLAAARVLGMSHIPAYVSYHTEKTYPDDHLYDIPPGTRGSGHRRIGPVVKAIVSNSGPGERTAMSWYHVSPHDLPDGTTLTPGGGRSLWDDVPYERGGNAGSPNAPAGPRISDRVWLDNDREASDFRREQYQELHGHPVHQYEVETDHEPEDFNGEYAVPQAVIKRRVSHRTAAVTVYRTAMPAQHAPWQQTPEGHHVWESDKGVYRISPHLTSRTSGGWRIDYPDGESWRRARSVADAKELAYRHYLGDPDWEAPADENFGKLEKRGLPPHIASHDDDYDDDDDDYGWDDDDDEYDDSFIWKNWYHSSPHKLPVGTVITPGGGESPFEGQLTNRDWRERGHHVWVTDDLNDAHGWRNFIQDGTDKPVYLYRVQPHTPPVFDSDDTGHSTSSAVVKELVHDPTQPTKEAHLMTAAVTVYTKPSCVQCDMTHKLLDRLGIEHDTVDVTADPQAHAYVTGLGYQAAPVVVVNNGESHWAGFRPERLKELVGGE